MTTDDAKTYLSKREIPRLFESLMTGLMYHRPGDHIKYLIDCLSKVQDKGQENITWSSFVDIRRSKTPLPPINGHRRPSSKGSRPSSHTRGVTPKGEDIFTVNFDNLSDDNNNDNNSAYRELDASDTTYQRLSMSPSHLSEVSPRCLSDTMPRCLSDVSPQNLLDISAGRLSDASLNSMDIGLSEDVKSLSPLPAISTANRVDLPDLPIVLVMGAPGSGKNVQVEKLLQRYPDWVHLNMGDLIKQEITTRGDAHAKWRMTKDLLNRGEAAPEDVAVEVLVKALMGCSNSKGVIVNGFPRSLTQVTDYDKLVGRVDCVFMLDCDEQIATDRLLRRGKESSRPEDSLGAIATRLNYFKSNTLPTGKHFDDQGKLVVIDGDGGPDVVEQDFGKAFDSLFYSKYGSTPLVSRPPGSASSTAPPPATYRGKWEKEDSTLTREYPLFPGAVPKPATVTEPDSGRRDGLPQCPIIFVAGGPGSGKGTQCERIVKRYSGFQHISMGDIIRDEISTKGTADDKWTMISQLVSKGEMAPEEVAIDLLKETLKKHMSAKAFVIEGFPRDKDQVESFNKHIGGLSFVMLFDCEEYFMQTRLMKRGKDSGRIDDNLTAIANRINFYKHNTLPVLKHFDDIGKLVVLDADRDMEEMFYDISKLFDFALFGQTTDGESDDSQEKAAIKIQANFRGYMVRSGKSSDATQDKLSTDDEKETKEHVSLSEKEAKGRIQAGFHGYKVRQNYQSPPDDDSKQTTHEPMDDDEAASRIQAGFHGYKTRSKLKSSKKQDDDDDTSKKSDEAASRLHASYRGYKTRQKYQSTKAPKKESQD